MNELWPCKKCGSNDVVILDKGKVVYWAVCVECGNENGSVSLSENGAEYEWNLKNAEVDHE